MARSHQQEKSRSKTEMKKRVKRTARGSVKAVLRDIVRQNPEVQAGFDRGLMRHVY
jgi:hypothetical protein